MALLEQTRNLFRFDGAREQEPLQLVASHLGQHHHLFLLLHAFGHHAHPERFRHREDGFNDRARTVFRAEAFGKRPVNFQHLKR